MVGSLDVATIVGVLGAALRDRADIRVVLLFGSAACGRARAGSDVDIAVLASGVDLLSLGADLADRLGTDVDVVDLARAGVPLLEEILRDGIAVHEGVEGAVALWRSRALASLETDRPWFARMRDRWLAHVAERGI